LEMLPSFSDGPQIARPDMLKTGTKTAGRRVPW